MIIIQILRVTPTSRFPRLPCICHQLLFWEKLFNVKANPSFQKTPRGPYSFFLSHWCSRIKPHLVPRAGLRVQLLQRNVKSLGVWSVLWHVTRTMHISSTLWSNGCKILCISLPFESKVLPNVYLLQKWHYLNNFKHKNKTFNVKHYLKWIKI